jgi:transposase-like protein
MKNLQKRYTTKFKNEVLEEYSNTNNNSSVGELAVKYSVNPSSIYSWINKRKQPDKTFSVSKAEKQDSPPPETKKKNSPMVLDEVRFCPCCGTDIIAVSIAITAAKQGYYN